MIYFPFKPKVAWGSYWWEQHSKDATILGFFLNTFLWLCQHYIAFSNYEQVIWTEINEHKHHQMISAWSSMPLCFCSWRTEFRFHTLQSISFLHIRVQWSVLKCKCACSECSSGQPGFGLLAWGSIKVIRMDTGPLRNVEPWVVACSKKKRSIWK